MRRDLRSVAVMAVLIVVSDVLALGLAPILIDAQAYAFPDPGSPANVPVYVGLILAFTAVILALFRFGRRNAVKWIILGSIFLTLVVVLSLGIYLALWPVRDDVLRGNAATVAAVALSAIWVVALDRYPEWYTVDAAGLTIAVGVTAILGISLTILNALVLLLALAVYDAWAVYSTKHMVALADAVTGERLPVLLVVPKHMGYSYLTQKPLREQLAKGEEREAMFMGLGDVIIPGVLVVSAFAWTGSLSVAIGTLVGTLVGFSVLMRFVMSGRPQAGLPFLNAGAILGYLATSFAVFRTVRFL